MRCQSLLAEATTAEPAAAALERLEPEARVAVLMALVALVLVGLLLLSVIVIGARWVRRVANERPRQPLTSTDSYPAASKQAAEPADLPTGHAEQPDTTVEPPPQETRLDG
ncbi:MAG: hypothetical protein AAGJ46_18110 [Planctomycetota bacterium]